MAVQYFNTPEEAAAYAKQSGGQVFAPGENIQQQNLSGGYQAPTGIGGILNNLALGIVQPVVNTLATGAEGIGALDYLLGGKKGQYKPTVFQGEQAQQLQKNPARFMTQRAADIGSVIASGLLPGASSLGGAVGSGALIGGLSNIGAANKDQNLLEQGLAGATVGGLTGGALYGIGSLLDKAMGATKGISKASAKAAKGSITPSVSTKRGLSDTVELEKLMGGNGKEVGIVDFLKEANNGVVPADPRKAVQQISQLRKNSGQALEQLFAPMNDKNVSVGRIVADAIADRPDLKQEIQKQAAAFLSDNADIGVPVLGGYGGEADKLISGYELFTQGKKLGNIAFAGTNPTEAQTAQRALYGAIDRAKNSFGPEVAQLNNIFSKTSTYKKAFPELLRRVGSGDRFPTLNPTTILARFLNRAGQETLPRALEAGQKINTGNLSGVGQLLQKASIPVGVAATIGSRGSENAPIEKTVAPTEMKPTVLDKAIGITQYNQQKSQIALELLTSGATKSPTDADKMAELYMKANGIEAPKTGGAASTKDVMNAKSGLQSLDQIEKIIKEDPNKLYNLQLPGALGARDLDQANRNAMDVIARMRTGAAMNKNEEAMYRQFLPSILDDEKTRQQKIDDLRALFESIANQ